jgi:hypothetical protein
MENGLSDSFERRRRFKTSLVNCGTLTLGPRSPADSRALPKGLGRRPGRVGETVPLLVVNVTGR